MMYDYIIKTGHRPVIIATKLDKIKRSQKDKNLKVIRETLGMSKEETLIPYSAETKAGREEVLKLIEDQLFQSSLISD